MNKQESEWTNKLIELEWRYEKNCKINDKMNEKAKGINV